MGEERYAVCGCPHCGNHIEYPESGAGQEIKCPHCTQPVVLNVPAVEEAPPPGIPSAQEILAALGDRVPRAKVSFFYQLGLMLVTLVMVLLPVCYVALIGAAAYGVYYYATHAVGMLHGSGGGARIYFFKVLIFVTPLIVGGAIVLFMVKPLFARRAPSAQPLALNPDAEPLLFAFIAAVCQSVGAPMPSRVHLDCRLNASASFRRGFISLFGNDLVLTIGLPLVAGLDMRQFAGVLAHEFGHFTQGFAMRLEYIVARVNGWFARVVFERDAWDLALESWAEDAEDWRVSLVLGLTRLGIWFSRLILTFLMYLGHGVSCFMSRQMEYDADSYEIKVAGSAGFESTMLRLHELDSALRAAYKDMRTTFHQARWLPDNLPYYLMVHCGKITPKQREQIHDQTFLEATGMFDTHPSAGDRIKNARQANDAGIFRFDAPASCLFANFEVPAKQVTHWHYTDDLGIDFDPIMLKSISADGLIEGRTR